MFMSISKSIYLFLLGIHQGVEFLGNKVYIGLVSVFHSGCIHLYPLEHSVRVAIIFCPCQLMLFSVTFIFAILVVYSSITLWF